MIFKYFKVLGRYSKYFSDTPILLETHFFDTHTHTYTLPCWQVVPSGWRLNGIWIFSQTIDFLASKNIWKLSKIMNNVYLLTNFPEQLLKIFLPSIWYSNGFFQRIWPKLCHTSRCFNCETGRLWFDIGTDLWPIELVNWKRT